MTPLMLQDDLVAELKVLFDGYVFKTTEGELVPINVYAQAVPVNPSDDDPDPIPYIIVRLISGEHEGGVDDPNTVTLAAIVGVWDDAPEAQGHREVMNVIQRIYERFAKVPDLRGRAVFNGDFAWVMQEDTYFPYSFGAASMTFTIPAIRREDPFI